VAVSRKVFEATMIGSALAAGLAAIEGYKKVAITLELVAFASGFMSFFAPGLSFIFRKPA